MKVSSVEVFAFSKFLLDQGKLALEQLFFSLGHLQVELKAAVTFQLLKTHPPSPPHTDTVQDEGTADVDLSPLLGEITIGVVVGVLRDVGVGIDRLHPVEKDH